MLVHAQKDPIWLEMVVFMSRERERADVRPEGPCLAGDGCVDV